MRFAATGPQFNQFAWRQTLSTVSYKIAQRCFLGYWLNCGSPLVALGSRIAEALQEARGLRCRTVHSTAILGAFWVGNLGCGSHQRCPRGLPDDSAQSPSFNSTARLGHFSPTVIFSGGSRISELFLGQCILCRRTRRQDR